MNVLESIFLDFSLPNATTWFYFSFLLAVALFFKFNRLLSIRNWDVLTIFLLVPGILLLLHQSRPDNAPLWLAYLWLLVGSGYLLLRCLFDLVLVRRPALGPNLSIGGLAWLAGALFVCLTAVAFRPANGDAPPPAPSAVLPADSQTAPIGQPTAPLQLAREPFGLSFFSMLCHLAVVLGLMLIGKYHFHDAAAGMAAATFYLLAPYTAYFVWQAHHVWPTALLIWAFVFYRKPFIAGLFLGVAAGTAFFPALLLPIWVSFYWRRGAGRFLLAVVLMATITLATTGMVLWMHDDLERIIDYTFALPDWQPWKLKSPTQESVWSGVHWAYRLPVSILYLALVITTAFWPNPKNLAHVLALSAVVLIGIQFWFADQGGVYILWYLPLLLLIIFRPNLSEYRPPPIQPETDWLTQSLRKIRGGLVSLIKPADPLVRSR